MRLLRFPALFAVGLLLASRANPAVRSSAATPAAPAAKDIPLPAIAPPAGDMEATRKKLAQIAANIHYFEIENIISNRGAPRTFPDDSVPQAYGGGGSYGQDWPESLEKEYDQSVSDLRALGGQREALIALVKDYDPVIRTLALGALFEREDGRDLPAIASLVGDHAVTLPRFNQVDSYQGRGPGVPVAPGIEQTVGEAAQAMLACYFRAANFEPNLSSLGLDQPDDSSRPPRDDSAQFTTAFAKYWAGRENRTECASWFVVKMDRASRHITPIQSGYRADITKVIAEINAVPLPERALTMLYVLHDQGWWLRDEDRLTPESTLVNALKQLGPADTLRFLQRQRLSDDPDLQFGDYAHNKNELFSSMANLILRNATTLLQPAAADALLACEQTEQAKLPSLDREVSTWWAAAAAELTAPAAPAHASEILHAALARHPAGTGEIGQEEAQSVLIMALWKTRGTAEKDFIVNWFYDSSARATDVRNGPISLLRVVQAESADPKGLLAALVADQHFARTDWETLRQMLTIVNESLGVELVSQREIYDHQPNSERTDQAVTLAAWRNALRKQFNVPQKAALVIATPQKILTTPAQTIALAAPATHLAISPDGQFLAVLAATQNRPAAQIINTVSGQVIWNVPAPTRAAWTQIVFTATPAQVLLFNSSIRPGAVNASVGDIAAQILTPKSGRFPSGDAGVFDRAAMRQLLASNNALTLHDLADGKELWQDTDLFKSLRVCLALAPDASIAAAGGGYQTEKEVTLYDGAKGTKLREITDFAAPVCAIEFASDSRTLVTATAGNGIQVWDSTTGKLEREFIYPVTDTHGNLKSSPLALSPDGRWVAVIGLPTWPQPADNNENPVGIFDLATGELRWELHVSGSVAHLVFSLDDKTLYTAGDSIQVWKLDP